MRLSRVWLGAAVVLTLLVGHLLRDTPGYVVRNPDGSLSGDITHYVYWTRLVTLGGIQSAYGGTWPETYAVYPPVTLYPLELVGNLYQRLQDPSFDPELAQISLWLHEGIKFVALAWHVVTGLAIFMIVKRMASERTAAIAASLFLLNPAALYDVAHWAQPDGAHSVFSVLAVGLLSLGQVAPAWAAMAAALLAKPQAAAIVLLFTVATFRTHGAFGIARGAVGAAITALIITLPFIVAGTLDELLTLPSTVSTVMPVVSADAHNLWWLVLQLRGQDPLVMYDGTRLLGPVTYRMIAGALVGATMLVAVWLYWTRRAGLAETAALSVLGWFTFTTQAHENHLFFALPLLVLAWPGRHSLLIPFGILSVTLLLNMLLHDQLVLEGLGSGLYDPRLEPIRLANAGLNVLCCLGWFALAALRRHDPSMASATVSYWPQKRSTRIGLEANG